MLQLVYLSNATTHFNNAPDDEINDILDIAIKFNQEHDITGMLAYRSGIFLQILEGEKYLVQELFGRIAMDQRHESIRVLIKQECTERLFPHWSMAYKKIDNADMINLEQIYPWEEIINASKSNIVIPNDKILEIFKCLRFKNFRACG